jgi:hypothetical protein
MLKYGVSGDIERCDVATDHKQEFKHDDSRSTLFVCNECPGNIAPCLLSFDKTKDKIKPRTCVIGSFSCNWREQE